LAARSKEVASFDRKSESEQNKSNSKEELKCFFLVQNFFSIGTNQTNFIRRRKLKSDIAKDKKKKL
jgi:hypothetical protein